MFMFVEEYEIFCCLYLGFRNGCEFVWKLVVIQWFGDFLFWIFVGVYVVWCEELVVGVDRCWEGIGQLVQRD